MQLPSPLVVSGGPKRRHPHAWFRGTKPYRTDLKIVRFDQNLQHWQPSSAFAGLFVCAFLHHDHFLWLAAEHYSQ